MNNKIYLFLGILIVVIIAVILIINSYLNDEFVLKSDPVVIDTQLNKQELIASSPMDLSLSINQFSDDKTSYIVVSVGKREGYKTEWFQANNTKIEIKLPEGLEIIEGNSNSTINISGAEIFKNKIRIKAVKNGEWVVEVHARSYETPLFDYIGDIELLFILVNDNEILISDRSFTSPSGEEYIRGMDKVD